MPKKSSRTEMQRLRAAGFSLANAERLSRDQRGPGTAIFVSAAVALVLAGGIVALTFDMTRKSETAQRALFDAPSPQLEPVVSPQTALATEPNAPVAVATTTPASDLLGASTLQALKENRLSQSLSVQVAAHAEANPEQITRSASGISATLDTLTSAAIRSSEPKVAEVALEVPEVTPEPEAQIDCVAGLMTLVREVKVPFGLASAALPSETPAVLDTIVDELNNCKTARLMITGHSDSTGPEIANIQMSWQRADAIMSRLVLMGAASDRMEVVGFGTRVPVTPDAAADAPENRRVDFRVLRREETQG